MGFVCLCVGVCVLRACVYGFLALCSCNVNVYLCVGELRLFVYLRVVCIRVLCVLMC